ncbi:O-antigen ligase family protein [Bradyrhizobium sp. U87765 SZCCT0131]|uniref:O-antigen ligase family protein n=1 Tax=unclassified Bradyrhizobium TaxID=2631580 RepID=UPI001BAA3927|nr:MULTISPECIES: O-antigen ligase family protein [unclassified Bradyrhizobium]MBR1219966.1 O-antigen ligase family protein [Bradyrhizobium sp. U87765 SZCCT0131]MBR1263578.1 O-antigen ligase family protein [Bradyrhizobium sp. U87765 SZCCT0134]MBR1309147.1 O-antigen ligase family protein [Bradyrhizobium sp. U87765 SZCCT0110]MBR1323910.1 O-antigen ligase family protein [Bradyrhizobium sp. U87765 SZCCT0109]MBR1349462.1 O-antigen ligase family protein [Bradyrhizobium sp. U87765 SZCCT0048]
MAYSATAPVVVRAPQAVPGVNAVQLALMWLAGISGSVVIIEPSPYELVVVASLAFFAITGLRLRMPFVPLMLFLFLINIGYTICAAYLMDESKIVNWILTSWYMAISAVFFAMVFAQDTAARITAFRRGLIAGALIASLTGIIGYFHLVPGRPEAFTLYSRAAGTFKDPNVLGAFLILPALFVLQSVLTDRFGKAARSTIIFGIIALGVLLSFSRAAWGQLVFTAALLLVLMYITSPSKTQRARLVILAVVGVAAAVLAVAVLLSFDSIGNLFKERAAFEQSYDAGRFGRFGRYVLGAQMALDLPLGIGPLQFTKYFPEDTHNSYLNAFMSGGWISGIFFPSLVFTTVILGFRHIFARVPWQQAYLAVFAAFLGTVGESFIIDVDHWRHFWMMLGAMWGMFVAAWQYAAARGSASPAR